MLKRTTLTGLLFILFCFPLLAQEVEIKDNKVYLDGKPILKYEKISPIEHSFYSLETDDEILLYKAFDNETRSIYDDYYILNFLTEKKKVETFDFSKITVGIGMNTKKNMQKMIGWLLKEKVLTAEGKINPEKLEIFVDKYNENIRERTIRN